MASIAVPLGTPAVSLGSVLQRAIDTVRHNAALTIGLAIVLGAAPFIAIYLQLSTIDRSALVLTVAGYALPGVIALTLLEWFASFVIAVLVQGAMTVPVLAAEEGRRAGLRETLAPFARNLLSLLGLGALTALAFEIGMTLLVIPAVVVYLLWSVAPSALVAEGDGAFIALNRSQELTEGVRWKVFGILALLEVVNIAIGLAAVFIAMRLFDVHTGVHPGIGYIVVLAIVHTVTSLMWATVQASLYVELVRSKEGGSVDTLEQVFA